MSIDRPLQWTFYESGYSFRVLDGSSTLPAFWGASSADVLNAAGILALSGTATATSGDLTFTQALSGQRLFVAVPAVHGPFVRVTVGTNVTNQIGAYTGANGTFTSPLTISVTPSGGTATDYLLYRSNLSLTDVSGAVSRTFSRTL